MLSELQAWRRVARTLTETPDDGGFLCWEINDLSANKAISPNTREKMESAVEEERKRRHISKDRMAEDGLWGWASKWRLKWVQRRIEKLGKSR